LSSEERVQQLMQRGECEPRLGLHPGSGQDGKATLLRPHGGLRDQRRLPDASLTADDQRTTAVRDAFDQGAHTRQLLIPAEEQRGRHTHGRQDNAAHACGQLLAAPGSSSSLNWRTLTRSRPRMPVSTKTTAPRDRQRPAVPGALA